MKWTDVTKKTPPLNVPILVANNLLVDGSNPPEFIQHVYTAVIVEEFKPGYGNITHWMPKPLPPKLSKRHLSGVKRCQP